VLNEAPIPRTKTTDTIVTRCSLWQLLHYDHWKLSTFIFKLASVLFVGSLTLLQAWIPIHFTPWGEVLSHKPPVILVRKNFLTLNGTRGFIIMFTSAQMNLLCTTLSYCSKIHFNIILPTYTSSKWPLHFRLSCSSCVLHAVFLSSLCLHHSICIWWRVQVKKLLVMKISRNSYLILIETF
jgi:hypothetical protein